MERRRKVGVAIKIQYPEPKKYVLYISYIWNSKKDKTHVIIT